MSTFQTLMKKAAALTSASSKEAADLLAQREADLRKARQQQDERDAKEREQRKTQLLREVEARKKVEADEARKEQEARKRQEEKARGALDPDPLVARAVQHLQNNNRKSRSSSPRAGSTSAATALTREEKRALADPLFRETVTARPRGVSAHPKSNRRLPGGGVARKPTQALSASSSRTHMSAKERIAASFQTLTPLNTVKKDMRTIDEITRDLERGRFNHSPEKVELTGYEATAFTDWFGKSKKEREREAALARKPQEGSASGKGPSEPPSSSSSSSLPKQSPRNHAGIQSSLTNSALPTTSVTLNNNNRLAKIPAGTSQGKPMTKQGMATSSSNARPRSSSNLANARLPPSSSSRPVASSQSLSASSSAHRKRSQASRSAGF
ncbi:hypothetical protein BS47DRAFT_867496 [Hydnum rufescens UP504]|uniref:Uncharacterized protein n=1 Tax=Hydnum rufescens UP504 TaxID=1448309 RepID=A0A9P6DXA4_9AGAM|nr:hypothetical protein BS47DRAFT_867496 [Hydnum rufescens UP504]